MGTMSASVLIINAGHEPMRRVSVKKAIQMVLREVAVIHEEVEGQYFGGIPVPVVVRLVRYIKMGWRSGTPKYSKKRLFQRDNRKCAYCPRDASTVDHVKPKSKGGEDKWDNVVAACQKCNAKKGNRTLKESGMVLRFEPFVPTWQDLFSASA
jgi:hypothetical protein